MHFFFFSCTGEGAKSFVLFYFVFVMNYRCKIPLMPCVNKLSSQEPIFQVEIHVFLKDKNKLLRRLQ